MRTPIARPLWLEEKKAISFSRLEKQIDADVVIVGGGITGLLTAYYLLPLVERGKRVVILEQYEILSGETGHTTAFLTYYIDTAFQDLIKKMGIEGARQVIESNKKAIDELERIAYAERIECDFMRLKEYVFARSRDDFDFIKKEAKSASDLGLDITISDSPLSFIDKGHLLVPEQAKFHPVKFLYGIASLLQKKGVRIFERSAVRSYEGNGPFVVTTDLGLARAEEVVVATHNPTDASSDVQSRIIPKQTYIIALAIPKEKVEEALYMDTYDPYHYIRLEKQSDCDLLIIGGEDHRTGEQHTNKYHFEELEKYFKTIFPHLSYEIAYQWSGQVLETVDGLPYIGRSVISGHLVSTGYAGNGMTFGTVGAMMISDMIAGNDNPWIDTYTPKRLASPAATVSQGAHYIKEMVTGRTLKQTMTVEEIPKSGGGIVMLEGKRVAVYKNKDGSLIKLSPVCTHLKCIVSWNDAESSWDCPCHGSRFSHDGEVMRGPATSPLEKLE